MRVVVSASPSGTRSMPTILSATMFWKRCSGSSNRKHIRPPLGEDGAGRPAGVGGGQAQRDGMVPVVVGSGRCLVGDGAHGVGELDPDPPRGG